MLTGKNFLKKAIAELKVILILFLRMFLYVPPLAGISHPVLSELHKSCGKGGAGTCRLECYKSEMLVDLCQFRLECCVTGNPEALYEPLRKD
ncbi:beta-defensin 134 [Sorex araneus]|uniref:beta-defensin 134 n=1 Tax=Sorex araneus TaxID=42254 RepID=UPI002433EF14|nr:beta-defensin 134 [Sorex araneus]